MTPQELKSSILQLAIQGKLVEQRPEEGTAEELYRQIQEEKKHLIKEGKIKKEKPLPEITEDEVPFEIPESWKWVHLSESGYTQTGNTPSKSHPEYVGSDIPFITPGDILEGHISYNNQALSNIGKTVAHICGPNTILQVCIGGSIGKAAITNQEVSFNQQINSISPIHCNSKYIYAVIISQCFTAKMKEVAGGTATPIINRGLWDKLLIPLPPHAEQERIVAKIEELLPYIERYEQAWNRLEDFSKRFPVDMQKSLLQWAIQGKLVEQRPEEGTAEELYRQIQEEKQRLVKEGKIKKEKPLPEITENEVPFEIPENWMWVRVGEIFAHNTGKAMNSSAKKVDKSGVIRKFITTSNLYWNSFDFSSVKEMFFSDDELERCTVTKGDLLMCEGGAYFGRTAIWGYDYDICFQNHIHRLRSYRPVELLFFYHLFYFYKSMNMMRAKGTAMPGLSSQILHQMPIPLPPLAEQKRVVARLEELLPLCERLK